MGLEIEPEIYLEIEIGDRDSRQRYDIELDLYLGHGVYTEIGDRDIHRDILRGWDRDRARDRARSRDRDWNRDREDIGI